MLCLKAELGTKGGVRKEVSSKIGAELGTEIGVRGQGMGRKPAREIEMQDRRAIEQCVFFCIDCPS